MHAMLNIKNKDEKDNRVMITVNEAARILNISTATVKRWSDMGLLQTSISPGKRRMFRMADVLTFLPEGKSPLSLLTLTEDETAAARFTRQSRQKLARINVQAITELTKQSVSRISHLSSSPTVTSRK